MVRWVQRWERVLVLLAGCALVAAGAHYVGTHAQLGDCAGVCRAIHRPAP